MKKHFTFSNLLFIILLSGLAACSKTTDTTTAPELTTNDVTIDAAAATAWSGGYVTSSSATAYGICYSTSNPQPTIADSKTSETVSYLSFTSSITNLTPNTVYYLRAYATYNDKTGYGDVIKFNTGDLSNTYGRVSTFAGSTAGGFIDGPLLSAQFDNPMGIAQDAAGNIYIADSFNCSIRKINTWG